MGFSCIVLAGLHGLSTLLMRVHSARHTTEFLLAAVACPHVALDASLYMAALALLASSSMFPAYVCTCADYFWFPAFLFWGGSPCACCSPAGVPPAVGVCQFLRLGVTRCHCDWVSVPHASSMTGPTGLSASHSCHTLSATTQPTQQTSCLRVHCTCSQERRRVPHAGHHEGGDGEDCGGVVGGTGAVWVGGWFGQRYVCTWETGRRVCVRDEGAMQLVRPVGRVTCGVFGKRQSALSSPVQQPCQRC